MKGFRDTAKHAECGYKFVTYRRASSAGKVVQTWCFRCGKFFKAQAGLPPSAAGDASLSKEKP